MNRFLPLTFLLLAAHVAHADEIAKFCDAKKSFLDFAYAQKLSFEDVLIKAASKDVVVIGESHSERSSKFYRYALKTLQTQDPKLNCVMVEQPQTTWQPALDACNPGVKCDRDVVPDFSGVQAALDLGLKVFAVDADVSLNDQNYADEVPMRNRAMVSNLVRLQNSNVCNHSVLIIGSMHGHRYKKTKSVLDLIRESGRTLSSLEIASPGLDSFDHLDQRWVWTTPQGAPICKESPPILDENFALPNSSAPRLLPIIYGAFSHAGTEQREFLGSWRDYDSTVFIGCSNPEVKTCAKPALRAL